MNEKSYKLVIEVADENHLAELFVQFMLKRFPDECDKGYIQTWADRFMSGNPAVYMDKQSLTVYKNLINKFLK